MASVESPVVPSPFDLNDDVAYRAWREAKLRDYPREPEALIVEVRDPRRLSDAEHEAIRQRIGKTNMAVYAGATGSDPDKEIPRQLGRQFGLRRLDQNYLADDDGLSSITVNPEGAHPRYIPYTDRPIKWHTDGYYNAGADKIRAMILHCVQPAASGGVNHLLDHEIAYILLRDRDPELVRALMGADVMSIPARMGEEGVARQEVTGPVFSVEPDTGDLHMRYTARKRNIAWKDDAAVREAVTALEAILASELPYTYTIGLEPGMGLICNNVLHDRTAFEDQAGRPPRLLYRARYFDRVEGTGRRDLLY